MLIIGGGVLGIVGFAVCTAVALNGRAQQTHLKLYHEVVWRKLGFPLDDSFWVKAKNERQAASAESALRDFLRSGEYKKLQDPVLDGLVRRGRWLVRAAVAIFVVFLVGAFFM